LLTFIHWIVIYPVDSVIQPLNNWGLYFGTRRPFYHERLRRRSINFGHGHYRYVCMQSQLLDVEVRSRSKQFFWGALSLINIHCFCGSCHCAYFSGIYHFHWRVVYCFPLGIQTHARDVVYMQ